MDSSIFALGVIGTTKALAGIAQCVLMAMTIQRSICQRYMTVA